MTDRKFTPPTTFPAEYVTHGGSVMSEAPKRIWADGNAEWDSGSWGLDKEFDDDVEYIRADLVEAAIKRALDKALMIDAKYFGGTGISHHIRALNHAQFVDGDKT
jgi:hypothetical protein